MKKISFKKQTNIARFAKPIKFNIFWAVLIMVVAGGVGVYTLRGSSAAATATVFIEAVEINPTTGTIVQHLSGVNVFMSPTTSCSAYPGTGNPAVTPANGIYGYGTCQSGTFCLEMDQIYKSGYNLSTYKVFSGATDMGGGCATVPDGGNLTIELKFTVVPPAPQLTFTANPTTITQGGSATLNWSSANATACVSTTGNLNTSNATTGSQLIQPAATTSYGIKCSGGGGSITKTATVTVNNPAAPPATSKPSTTPPKTTTTKPKSTPTATGPVVKTTGSDTSPPTQPGQLVASIENGTALITWPAASDNVGVVSYMLERSEDGTTWDVLGASITNTSYEDTTVDSDASYYYRVRAQDAAGNQSATSVSDLVEPLGGTEEAAPEDTSNALPAKKKQKSPVVFLVVGGVILALAAGVGLWLYRRRMVASDQYNNYYVAPPAASSPPLTPPTTVAPHTSKSLKDMVLEDLNGDHSKDQPPRV